MADADVSINISGDATGAQAAFKQAADAAKEAAGSMGEAFKSIGGALDAVREHFAAITAVLAGGAIFKESIGEAKAFTGEVTQLSKQLGISAQEASGLNVALASIGSDADNYTGALSKLTKQVRTNEAGLNAMGIATRDSNGHFLDGRDLMDSAIKALLAYKEGTDRNLAAQVAFGKGAQESAALLKLSRDIQEEGAKTARELNLIIGPENQAAVKTYKVGMIEVGEVMKAIENTIGQAVIPALGELAKWFAQVGPPAIAVFKPIMAGVGDVLLIVVDAVKELWSIFASAFSGILKIVAFALTGDGSLSAFGDVCSFVFGAVKIALLALEQGFSVVFGAIGTIIEVASAYLRRFGTTAELALRGEWGQAKAAWAKGTAEIEKILDDSGKRMIDSAQRTQDKIKAILFPPKAEFHDSKSYGNEPDKGKRYNGEGEKEKKDPSRVAQWDAELAELKLHQQEEALTQGKFYEMSKADEKDFWDKKKALTVAGTAENLAVRKKDAELGLGIQKDAFEIQLQDLKTQSDAFKNNLAEKIRLAEQEATIIGQKYGLESKEYKAAQGDILKLKREVVAQEVELESAKQESLRRIRYSEIDLDQEIANERLALGLITETEMLQLERKFEDDRTQIAVSAQRARIAAMEGDPDHSPIALQKEKDQLLQIEQQHALAVQKINGKIAVDALTDYRSMVQSIGGALTSMFTSIATGQAKVGAAMKTMFTSVLSSAAEMLAQYLSKKAAAFAVETAMNSGFLSSKAAAELSALIAGNAAKSTAAAGEITASAGVAAAGGAAAMASIPYVGPVLAAGAYADMMALGLSALPLASAAGGWDIPGNLNPIVQAHAGEMILPAAIAKRFRSAAPGDGDDGSGGGRGDVHHHYNVNVNGPQDKRSMERWMADLLPGATNRSQRSFGMSK